METERLADLRPGIVSGKLYPACKRILDVVLALLGMGLMLLPIALIAAAIYCDDPGPVIFRQERLGRDGRPFTLYKLRTMILSAPDYVATRDLTQRDCYITHIGRFLRRTSLDEVPQLYNILKGDMSLVGPRPLIPGESDIHRMRHRFGVYALRPGITGLAQINGRDLLTPEQKVRWDVAYLHQFGFLTDLRVLLRTVRKVFYCADVVETATIDPSIIGRREEQEANL